MPWNGSGSTVCEKAVLASPSFAQPSTKSRKSRRQVSGGGGSGGSDYLLGGDYIVFVARGGELRPVPIRTGLTDLDYSEVLSGLTEQDTVLILPSASLIRQQQESQRQTEMMRSAMPGVQPMPGGGRR